jgi:putative transposase
MNFKRKVNRLELDLYCQERIYFITICTFDGQGTFKDLQVVNLLLEKLKACCKTFGFVNYVYCFMPDHLHLLLGGKEGSDLIKMIKQFKQLTGFHFKKETRKKLWQKSYYDHILRKEESIGRVVRYVLENPVRKGLVKHPEEYPLSGSLEFGKEIFKM